MDVVLDSLAREFVDASLRLLRPGGRFIEMGKKQQKDAKDERKASNRNRLLKTRKKAQARTPSVGSPRREGVRALGGCIVFGARSGRAARSASPSVSAPASWPFRARPSGRSRDVQRYPHLPPAARS
jgi:hypothetical protein